jgi:NAD(P)-dependent dehydrogenase (short-subunit alcohol dehydrogenase family)
MARTPTAESITQGIDLSGKSALVTGVNSGIGTETMRVLALRGARVIGTARTLEKAAEACTSVPGDTLPVACELTDLDSVRACAAAIRDAGVDTLDIVIANAGIMALPQLEQVNGIEKQFATNPGLRAVEIGQRPVRQ